MGLRFLEEIKKDIFLGDFFFPVGYVDLLVAEFQM